MNNLMPRKPFPNDTEKNLLKILLKDKNKSWWEKLKTIEKIRLLLKNSKW